MKNSMQNNEITLKKYNYTLAKFLIEKGADVNNCTIPLNNDDLWYLIKKNVYLDNSARYKKEIIIIKQNIMETTNIK